MSYGLIRNQSHPHGYVGHVFRIVNPDTVKIGDCFLRGRLLPGDLFLCTEHSGDCFQTYAYVKEYANCYVLQRRYSFVAYGIGDSEQINLTEFEIDQLTWGEPVDKPECKL